MNTKEQITPEQIKAIKNYCFKEILIAEKSSDEGKNIAKRLLITDGMREVILNPSKYGLSTTVDEESGQVARTSGIPYPFLQPNITAKEETALDGTDAEKEDET